MSIFRRNSGNATSAHDMLKEINKLSSALRGGMNPAAAAQIAQTTRSILKGTSVAVTDDTSILGISGTTVAWDEAVLEQTAGILSTVAASIARPSMRSRCPTVPRRW